MSTLEENATESLITRIAKASKKKMYYITSLLSDGAGGLGGRRRRDFGAAADPEKRVHPHGAAGERRADPPSEGH